jgi:hypothetical protein
VSDDDGSSTDIRDIFLDDGTDESLDNVRGPDSNDFLEDYCDDDLILDDEEEQELLASCHLQEAECLHYLLTITEMPWSKNPS